MILFSAVTFSLATSQLQSAAHSLKLASAGQYSLEMAWNETRHALEGVEAACEETPLREWLDSGLKIEGARQWGPGCEREMATCLLMLMKDVHLELSRYQALLVSPERRHDFIEPLKRWGIAADKFGSDCSSAMASASRCLALDEWNGAVFHSMCVLEHGLRWLAGQLTLTLSRPVQLEVWNTIIDNIESAIRREQATGGASIQRQEQLSAYARAAVEFRYFKDGWRNHVMHVRDTAHDEGTSTSVLNHVSSFMKVLAVRV
jgi:hypothetical protein